MQHPDQHFESVFESLDTPGLPDADSLFSGTDSQALLTVTEQVCLDHIGSTLRDLGVTPTDFPFIAASIVARAWIRASKESLTLGETLWDEALNLTADF